MAYNSLSEALRSPDFSGLSSEAKQYVFDKYSANDTAYNSLSEDAKAHVKEKYLGITTVNKKETKSPEETSALAAGTKTAVESIVPTMTGLAGAGRGAVLGARLPGPLPVKAGGALVGMLGGGALGGMFGQEIQEAATKYIPEEYRQELGFGKEQRALETKQHPYASFAGSMIPSLAAFTPGRVAPIVDQAGRTLMGPTAQRGAMAGLGGAIEAGSQAVTGQEMDPTKIAMAAGFQGIATNPTRLGRKLFPMGEAAPKAVEPDPYFERVVRQEERQTAREQAGVQPPISEEAIPVTPEGQAITDKNMEFFIKQAEERQAAATEQARSAELAAIDETMMQYPKDLQAPQYGMGGKIARHEDQVSRVKDKFEPGERTDQIEMDLNRQRVLQEEQQRLLDEDAAWKQREQELLQEQGKPLSKEEAFAQADERRVALEEQKQRQSQLDRIESELSGVQERLMQEPTVKVGQGPKTLAAKQLSLSDATANLVDSLAEATGIKANFMPGEGLGKSVVEFVRALGREGHTTYQKAVAAAKIALGDGWQAVKQFFKKAWDYVRTNPETVGSKTPFEAYVDNIRTKYPNATDEQITKAWELKTSDAADKIALQQKGVEADKVSSKLMHQAQRTGEVWAPEQQIQVYQTLDDADIGLITENLLSAGSRIQSEIINHPVVTQDINLVNRATDEAGIKAHHVLDDIKTGFFPKIHQFVATAKDGHAQMKQFVKWMFENEGNPNAKLPDTFDPQVREIYNRYIKGKSDLLKAMNDVLAKDDKAPINNIDNHMVHYWTGPYRAFIYVKGENGKSRLAFPIAEKTKADAEKAVKWVMDNVPNVDRKLSKDIKFVGADARSRASTFDLLLDMSNQKDPMVLDALTAFKDRIAASQEKHLGEQFRQKRRGGAEGYLGNKPWLSENANYQDAMDVMRRTFDAGYEWVAAQKVRQAREPILQAQNEGKISVGNALAFGQRYIDHAFGRNMDTSFVTKAMDRLEASSPKIMGTTRRVSGEVHNAANQIIYPWLLAGRLSSSVQAVAQIFQATIPRMLADIGAEGKAFNPKAYANAGMAVGTGLMDGMFQLFNTVSLGKFEKYQNQFYDLAGFKGSKEIAQAIRDMDISRISLSDSNYFREGGRAKTLANVALKGALNAPMTLMESPFRSWAFSSFARRALMEGYDMPTALAMARENMDSMVNYGRKNSSMGLGKLGPVGNEARGLHTFTINMYSQLAHYTTLAARSKNPAPLLAMLAGVYFTAGALGMIGVDLADALLDGVKVAARGTKYDTPELQQFSMRKWIIESDTPDWNKFGKLSEATGLGMYGSFAAKLVDPDRGLLDNLFPKATFGVELGKSAISAHKLLTDETLSESEKGLILESIAPKVLTQKIRNKYQNVTSVNPETGEPETTVYSPYTGDPMYKRTAKEQAISERALGTRSLAEVAAGEEMRLFKKGEKSIEESRSALYKSFDENLKSGWKEETQGKPINQARINEISRQIKDLQTKWGVTDESLVTHIKNLQANSGLPDEVIRRLVKMKTLTPTNVRQATSLMNVFQRNLERQQKYGK